GYAWYHMSGTAKVVSSAREMQSKFETIQKATPSPTSAASFLRSILESQIQHIPGSSSALRKFDEIADEHGPEVAEILKKTYNEIWDAVEKGGDGVGEKVSTILKNRAAQLKDVGLDAGEVILRDHPEVRKKLGSAFSEVSGWTQKYGPEAKKQADEVYAEVQKIIQSGVSAESLDRVRKLVDEKSGEVKELGRKAAQQAYEKGEQQAGDVLKRYPQVKEVLEQYKSQLLGGGVSVASITKFFTSVTKLKGSGEENAERVKEYVEDLVGKGKELTQSEGLGDLLGAAERYIKTIPGGEKFLSETPDIKKLVDIAQKRGPEAEKLATETWEELNKVLRKRYSQAEEIAEEGKKEVKQAK
ncbi:hypothetical protein EX30DRAFT_312500, partial [Ascodesmis nigricans]